MIIPRIMLAIRDPCEEKRMGLNNMVQLQEELTTSIIKRSDTYWSEDHVQRHGNVKVKSIVVDHTDSEEHGHHDNIVTEK